MAGQRRFNSNGCGLLVSNLADKHHIRVGTQNGTQCRGEGQSGLVVHLHLVDAAHTEFHRVFNGDDVDFRLRHITQRRIQGGGLTGTGRTGDQYHAVRPAIRFLEHLEITLREVQILHFEVSCRRGENTHDHCFAPHGRQRGHTQIHALARMTHGNTTVLWFAALADIKVGHDFDTADDALDHGFRGFLEHVEHAVDTVAYFEAVFLRFDMNIGAVVVDGLVDEQVDEPGDGGDVFFLIV